MRLMFFERQQNRLRNNFQECKKQKMRSPKIRIISKPVTNIFDDRIQVYPDIPRPITRALKKQLDNVHEFLILENYRCMPLLGDEEKVPNWDIHIVRYTIVYVQIDKVDNQNSISNEK